VASSPPDVNYQTKKDVDHLDPLPRTIQTIFSDTLLKQTNQLNAFYESVDLSTERMRYDGKNSPISSNSILGSSSSSSSPPPPLVGSTTFGKSIFALCEEEKIRSNSSPITTTIVNYDTHLIDCSTSNRKINKSDTGYWCHQCKKKSKRVVHCSKNRFGFCSKKFCKKCIEKHYKVTFDDVDQKNWTCAFCSGNCLCASCRRKRGEEVPKRVMRKRKATKVNTTSSKKKQKTNHVNSTMISM